MKVIIQNRKVRMCVLCVYAVGALVLTSTLEEMRNPKFFLNHRCIHAPLSHVRLCLSLSILPFESVKVGDHLDMHLGY